jgi:hypothetical protein
MSRDTTIIQGNRSLVRKEDVRNCKANRKLMWMPVKRVELKPVKNLDDLVAANALKFDEHQGAECAVRNTETSNIDGRHWQQTRSDAGQALKSGQSKIVPGGDGLKQQQRRWSDLVQKDTILERNLQNAKASSCQSGSVSRNGPKDGRTDDTAAEGTSLHDDLERNVGARSEKHEVRPGNSSTAGEYTDLYVRGNRNFEDGGSSTQQNMISAKYREVAPKTPVCQYRPRYAGGIKIMSVALGTKPGPRWCPTGFSQTQKHRVHPLQILEIRDGPAEKWRDEWLSENRPIIPTKRIPQRGTSSHI